MFCEMQIIKAQITDLCRGVIVWMSDFMELMKTINVSE